MFIQDGILISEIFVPNLTARRNKNGNRRLLQTWGFHEHVTSISGAAQRYSHYIFCIFLLFSGSLRNYILFPKFTFFYIKSPTMFEHF